MAHSEKQIPSPSPGTVKNGLVFCQLSSTFVKACFAFFTRIMFEQFLRRSTWHSFVLIWKNSMFSFMFAFSRINDFLSFNFYFWNLNKHQVLETVTLFSSVGINYFKMSVLKEYQLSALTDELPLTKIAQKLYQFLITKCPPFFYMGDVSGWLWDNCIKITWIGKWFLKIHIPGSHRRPSKPDLGIYIWNKVL